MPGRPVSIGPGGESPREPFRRYEYVALFLELVLVANAFAAGASMLLEPDGHGVSLPPWARGPFESFTVPGLLLFFVVGGSLAVAGIATLSRRPIAPLLTVIAGAVLCGWISVQVTLIGVTSFLQMFCFATGVLLMILYSKRAVRWVATP